MNYHRDYGDETDFDVVTSAAVRSKVNQTPIEPVISVSRADFISKVLEHGVSVGDFVLLDDGSLEPVVPVRGAVNHTWVRVLISELLIATGRDPADPGSVSLPDRVADLLRDLIR